jgi:hypothetical protein
MAITFIDKHGLKAIIFNKPDLIKKQGNSPPILNQMSEKGGFLWLKFCLSIICLYFNVVLNIPCSNSQTLIKRIMPLWWKCLIVGENLKSFRAKC